MSKAAKQEPGSGPKDRKKTPENWPDLPEGRTVEDTGERRDKVVDQMRHADNSDAIANSTPDTEEGVVGYTDALVDKELQRGDERGEFL